MTSKTLTYGDLDRLLLRMGFVHGHTTGNHKVYEHKLSDTIILLPPTQPNEIVDAMHLAGVRATIINRGVADEDVYDEALESLESTVLSRA